MMLRAQSQQLFFLFDNPFGILASAEKEATIRVKWPNWVVDCSIFDSAINIMLQKQKQQLPYFNVWGPSVINLSILIWRQIKNKQSNIISSCPVPFSNALSNKRSYWDTLIFWHKIYILEANISERSYPPCMSHWRK